LGKSRIGAWHGTGGAESDQSAIQTTDFFKCYHVKSRSESSQVTWPLAAHLLGSLPSVLHDEDEGIAEALRRDAEFEANPSLGMSLEELDQRIESRRS
jgi:hypothetical protein